MDTELDLAYVASQPDPTAVFLASDDASFINGSYLLVDGGLLARPFDLYHDSP